MIAVPQLNVELDREKARQLGVSVADLFDAMQIYPGSLYVSDFNSFGRVYQVWAHADAPFRATADNISELKTRNAAGTMMPLSSLVKMTPMFGPETVIRCTGFLAADINGGPARGYSSGLAMSAVDRIATETLPRGIKFECTDHTYQQLPAGNAALWVFPVSVLLVFLVLAILPIIPISILSALFCIWLPRRGQRHLHAGRRDGVRRPVSKERDSDCRIRA